VRYRLPYVAINETLLRSGPLGPALSTYLHELAHMFGGDNTTAFGHALSEMLSRTILHAGEIAAQMRQWDVVDTTGTAMDRRKGEPDRRAWG
jgi:hypothetical protein